MQVFLTLKQNSDGWVVFCRVSGDYNSISKQTTIEYFHYLLTLVLIADGKKEKQNCKQSGKLNHL